MLALDAKLELSNSHKLIKYSKLSIAKLETSSQTLAMFQVSNLSSTPTLLTVADTGISCQPVYRPSATTVDLQPREQKLLMDTMSLVELES